jgi:hypothetical protein
MPELLERELHAVAATLTGLQQEYRAAALARDDYRVHDLRSRIGKLAADFERLADQLFAKMGEDSGSQSSEAPR